MTNLTGDFAKAVRVSSEILTSRGRIYPSTAENVALEAELENGAIVSGETRISKSRRPIRRLRLKPAACKPLPETLRAIEAADLITFGPGSLFTSVIPNVLVHGIPRAIVRSRALKAYFVNLMWQPGETIGFSASDHIAAIHEHAGARLIDVAVVNTAPIRPAQRRKYAAQQAQPVLNDLPELAAMGIAVAGADLLAEGSVVRHNSQAAAAIAMDLARRGRARRRAA